MRWLVVTIIASAIFVTGFGVILLVTGAFDPIRKRLYDAAGYQQPRGIVSERVAKQFEAITPYILPQNWKRTESGQRLVYAGYRSPNNLAIYYGIKTLFMILLPASVFFVAAWFPHLTSKQVFLYAAVAGYVGMVIPSYVLDRKVATRKRWISNGFPDAIDLLVVCTEAGLGLNAALQRVARELAASHPALAEEMALVNAEIRAGVDRIEALGNLAKRTGLEDVRGFVTLLAQSLRFGTSVAETLRIYSEEFRDKRMQRAEEVAAKIGTKMIFPLVMCLFPGFFIIAVGPAALKIIAAFSGMNH